MRQIIVCTAAAAEATVALDDDRPSSSLFFDSEFDWLADTSQGSGIKRHRPHMNEIELKKRKERKVLYERKGHRASFSWVCALRHLYPLDTDPEGIQSMRLLTFWGRTCTLKMKTSHSCFLLVNLPRPHRDSPINFEL